MLTAEKVSRATNKDPRRRDPSVVKESTRKNYANNTSSMAIVSRGMCRPTYPLLLMMAIRLMKRIFFSSGVVGAIYPMASSSINRNSNRRRIDAKSVAR
jgi:hypothetical protein